MSGAEGQGLGAGGRGGWEHFPRLHSRGQQAEVWPGEGLWGSEGMCPPHFTEGRTLFFSETPPDLMSPSSCPIRFRALAHVSPIACREVFWDPLRDSFLAPCS